jgi:hypothetical protein
MHLQVMVSCHCKNDPHRLHFGDRSKNLIEINALALHIPFDDQSCLMFDNIDRWHGVPSAGSPATMYDFLRWKRVHPSSPYATPLSSVLHQLNMVHLQSQPIGLPRPPVSATPGCCANSRIFFIAQNRSGASSALWSKSGVDGRGDTNSIAQDAASAGEVLGLKLPTDSPPPLANDRRPTGDSRRVAPPSSGHAPRVVTCSTQNRSWSPPDAACSSWSQFYALSSSNPVSCDT